MSQEDIQLLLEKVKEGHRLSSTELQRILDELENEDSREDQYTLLHIVGKAQAREALPQVWHFLSFGLEDPTDDGMIRRIALQVVAHWWSLEEAFSVASEKAFKDPSPFVRIAAASAIGHLGYVHSRFSRQAAKLLMLGFERRTEEEKEVREAFYEGMLNLLAIPPAERPFSRTGLEAQDIDQEVLEAVRAKATE